MSTNPPPASTHAVPEPRRSAHAALLAGLAALFAARVVAQAVQRWLPAPFLPPFGAFQGSSLPYAVLLSAQFAILALMIHTSRRVRTGALQRRLLMGRALTVAGSFYFAAICVRIGIGLAVADAPAWFRATIPSVFHLVLSTFVLTLAAYHRQRRATHPERTAP